MTLWFWNELGPIGECQGKAFGAHKSLLEESWLARLSLMYGKAVEPHRGQIRSSNLAFTDWFAVLESANKHSHVETTEESVIPRLLQVSTLHRARVARSLAPCAQSS